MVEPKDGLDPLAEGADFRAGMIRYIRTHFAGRLGPDVNLLDQPNGLEILAEKHGPAGRRLAVA